MRLCAIVVSLVFVGACTSANAKGVTPTTTIPTTTSTSTTATTSSTSTTTTSTTSTTTTTYIQQTSSHSEVEYGSGACGGDLPPCYVMNRESGGNIRAKNPSSSASGKWQMLDSTWNGYGGYAHASDAPEWVQDAKARTMAPCNWEPPNYCA